MSSDPWDRGQSEVPGVSRVLTSISALVMVFDLVFGFMDAVIGVYDLTQVNCHRTPGTVGNLRSRPSAVAALVACFFTLRRRRRRRRREPVAVGVAAPSSSKIFIDRRRVKKGILNIKFQ